MLKRIALLLLCVCAAMNAAPSEAVTKLRLGNKMIEAHYESQALKMMAENVKTRTNGMGLYILADITHQKIEEVFEGFMPFFPALVVMLIVLTLVPQISTWLPNLLMP